MRPGSGRNASQLYALPVTSQGLVSSSGTYGGVCLQSQYLENESLCFQVRLGYLG